MSSTYDAFDGTESFVPEGSYTADYHTLSGAGAAQQNNGAQYHGISLNSSSLAADDDILYGQNANALDNNDGALLATSGHAPGSDAGPERRFYLTLDAHYTQYALMVLLGFVNNLSYVVVLSAAKSLARAHDKENLIGALQWANVGFGLVAKFINTAFFLNSSFVVRMTLCTSFMLSGLILTALSPSLAFEVAFLGILLIGSASALGESVLMGYFKLLDPALVGAWSSGTGFAGVGGSLIYLIMHTMIHLSDTVIFLVILPLSIAYYAAFSVVHTRYGAGSGKQMVTFEEAAAGLGHRPGSKHAQDGGALLGTEDFDSAATVGASHGYLPPSTAATGHSNNAGGVGFGSASPISVSRNRRGGGNKSRRSGNYYDDDTADPVSTNAKSNNGNNNNHSNSLLAMPLPMPSSSAAPPGLLLSDGVSDGSRGTTPALSAGPSSFKDPILPYGASPQLGTGTGPLNPSGRAGKLPPPLSGKLPASSAAAAAAAAAADDTDDDTATGVVVTRIRGGARARGQSHSVNSKRIVANSTAAGNHADGDNHSEYESEGSVIRRDISTAHAAAFESNHHFLPLTHAGPGASPSRAVTAAEAQSAAAATQVSEPGAPLHFSDSNSSSALASAHGATVSVAAAADSGDVSALTMGARVKRSFGIVASPAIQLALVYFFEYVVCVGFAAVANPDPETWAERNAYEILSLCYQTGVWISRSSIQLIQIRRFEIITVVQGFNFLFWFLHVMFGFMAVYAQFAAMLWVGLFAGAMYVNVFFVLLRDDKYEVDRELNLNIVSIFINIGVMMSSFFTLIADNTFLAKFH